MTKTASTTETRPQTEKETGTEGQTAFAPLFKIVLFDDDKIDPRQTCQESNLCG